MIFPRILLTLALSFWLFGPTSVQAMGIVKSGSTNNDYRRAISLGDDPKLAALYGRLTGTGDARYFVFSVSQPGEVDVELEIAHDPSTFEPRLVLYEPEGKTIGPALPMIQPPQTVATIYTTNGRATHHEGFLRTELVSTIRRTISTPVSGRYYLAVYNAGRGAGSFRLTVQDTANTNWPASMNIQRWWLTSIWFGTQAGTLTIPFIILIVAVVAWLIVRRVPAPVRNPEPPLKKKRTVTNVKRY